MNKISSPLWFFFNDVLGRWKIEIFLNNALGGWKIEICFEYCARRMKNWNFLKNAQGRWKIEIFFKSCTRRMKINFFFNDVLGGWNIEIFLNNVLEGWKIENVLNHALGGDITPPMIFQPTWRHQLTLPMLLFYAFFCQYVPISRGIQSFMYIGETLTN